MENEIEKEVSSSVAKEMTVPVTPSLTSPMTIGDWMLTLLISGIPLVGLVMLFVWAFGENANANKANWAKATLLWMLIGLILGALFFALFLSAARTMYSR